MNLEIKKDRQKHQTTLHLIGEVDVYTAPKLKVELQQLVSIADSHVAVDLSQVNYMDSTGLGAIIGALKMAKKTNARLTILNANDRIQRLFEITGLSKIIQTKREEADERT